MAVEMLKLPSSAGKALELLREASRTGPVLVFKKSPVCGASFQAEEELRMWLASRAGDLPLKKKRPCDIRTPDAFKAGYR